MGRRERDIRHPDRPLGRLATHLRRLRHQAGLTYEAMAEHTGGSTATFSRAADGKTFPTYETAASYAYICAATPVEGARIFQLWTEAQKDHIRRSRFLRRIEDAPRIEHVFNQADLAAALANAYCDSPAPSFRAVERRAETYKRRRGIGRPEVSSISWMTVRRIAHRDTIPRTTPTLFAYLRGCGIPEKDLPKWARAWDRAKNRELRERIEENVKQLALEAQRKGVAAQRMQEAGFEPLERYRGARHAWTVRCEECESVVRVRLLDVEEGTARCGGCRASELLGGRRRAVH